jgi:hypothetical protein
MLTDLIIAPASVYRSLSIWNLLQEIDQRLLLLAESPRESKSKFTYASSSFALFFFYLINFAFSNTSVTRNLLHHIPLAVKELKHKKKFNKGFSGLFLSIFFPFFIFYLHSRFNKLNT